MTGLSFVPARGLRCRYKPATKSPRPAFACSGINRSRPVRVCSCAGWAATHLSRLMSEHACALACRLTLSMSVDTWACRLVPETAGAAKRSQKTLSLNINHHYYCIATIVYDRKSMIRTGTVSRQHLFQKLLNLFHIFLKTIFCLIFQKKFLLFNLFEKFGYLIPKLGMLIFFC